MEVAERKPTRWGRILAFSLIGIGLLVVLIVGGAWFVARTELRPFLEQRLTQMLDRPVTIGTLDVTWRNPLIVEMSDLHLANASWGSTPDMGSVKSVSAEIDVKPLLSGRLRFLKLVIVGPTVTLERDPKGTGNWLFGQRASGSDEKTPPPQPDNDSQSKDKLANDGQDSAASFDQAADNIVPRGRSMFPTLLDFTLQDGKITYRTFRGHILRIDLDQIRIATTGDDQPVDLDATGAYNGSKLALKTKMHSFDEMRDASKPFGTVAEITRQSVKIDFDGTLMDPINADGAKGKLTINVGKLNDLLTVFGTKMAANPAVTLQGHLTHAGDIWHLADGSAQFGGNPLTGHVTVHEGSHGSSDDIDLALAFQKLNLDPLLSSGDQKKSSGGSDDWMKQPLTTPDKTSPRLTAKVSADQVKYNSVTLGAVDLSARIAPGEMSLAPSSITYAGVPVQVSASLKPADSGSRLTAEATAKGVDAVALMKAFGSTTNDLSGKLSAGMKLTLTGKTVQDGLKTSTGGAVLSMTNGRVSRDVLEKASMDLRNVFRKGEGTVQVTCLLGVMRLQNGIGQLDPLRLRTSQAVINGKGRVDFLHQTLDLTLQSDKKTTDFLALDIPVRLSGPWQKPGIELMGKSPQPKSAAAKLDDLSPGLRDIAAGNACRQ